MSSTHRPTLDERVMQFNMLQLPGQPMAMHMGTAYLVSDLHKRVKELEGALRFYAGGGGDIAKKALADNGEQTTPDIERLAEKVHNAYLETCSRLGWKVSEANRAPYADLSEDSKELDRATVRAVLGEQTNE